MMEKIAEIGQIEINSPSTVIQNALYALERFLFSNLCPNPYDEYLAYMIKPHMKARLREEYETYRLDHNKPDNAVTVTDYLRRLIRVKRQAEVSVKKKRESTVSKKDSKGKNIQYPCKPRTLSLRS